MFQVLSKGTILQLGKTQMRRRRMLRLWLRLTSMAAPRAQVLVYHVCRGEVVADSVSFSVAGVFVNKVYEYLCMHKSYLRR